MDNDLFDYIVSLLVRNANDSIEECRESKHDSFEEGRKQADYEVLDTIKNKLIVAEYNLEDCGLEFKLVGKFHMKRINWMLHRAEKAPAAGNDILSKRFGGSMEGYTYYFTYQLKRTKRRLMILKSSVRIGIVYIQKRELLIYVIGGKKLKTM